MPQELLTPVEAEKTVPQENAVEKELPELTGSALVFGRAPEVEAKVIPSATCRVAL